MQTTITVQNLKCGGCATTIKSRLAELKGVSNLQVNETESSVAVSYVQEDTLLIIKQKLAALGYPEVDSENGILTQAKSFVSCAVGRLSK